MGLGRVIADRGRLAFRSRWAAAAVVATAVIAGAIVATEAPAGQAIEIGPPSTAQAFRFPAELPAPAAPADLTTAAKKDIAMQLVASAENSTVDWRAQYGYIEDIYDGRGYTAGIVGFTSGTHDMLALVEAYTAAHPGNGLARYLPALRAVDGTASHEGLGTAFVSAWRAEAAKPEFQKSQEAACDKNYFVPAVREAKADGLGILGQFIYLDAIVMHGLGKDSASFGGIRAAALAKARPPAQGGGEKTYLGAFLDVRAAEMKREQGHSDTSRIDSAQRVFLLAGNVKLDPPLSWTVYGVSFRIG